MTVWLASQGKVEYWDQLILRRHIDDGLETGLDADRSFDICISLLEGGVHSMASVCVSDSECVRDRRGAYSMDGDSRMPLVQMLFAFAA